MVHNMCLGPLMFLLLALGHLSELWYINSDLGGVQQSIREQWEDASYNCSHLPLLPLLYQCQFTSRKVLLLMSGDLPQALPGSF